MYKCRRCSLVVIVGRLHLQLIAYASNMPIKIRSSKTLSAAPLACFCVAYFVTSDTQPVLVQMFATPMVSAKRAAQRTSRPGASGRPAQRTKHSAETARLGPCGRGRPWIVLQLRRRHRGRMCTNNRGRVSRARGPASIHYTLHKHQRHGLKKDLV